MDVKAIDVLKAMRGLRFVARGSTLPVFRTVRLTAEYGELTLTASDLDHTAIVRIPAATPSDDLLNPLQVCVYAEDLYKLANSLPKDADMALEFGADTLRVESDGLTVTLNGLNADEFPNVPDFESVELLSVERARVASWGKHLRRACSTEESRPILNGVRVRRGDLVATNGHRALMQNANGATLERGSPEWIVPSSAFRLAHKVLPKGRNAPSVRLVGSDDPSKRTFAAFESGDGTARLIVACIDGSYPNFEMVVPSDPAHYVEVDAAEFVEALGKVRPFASDQTKRVRLIVEAERVRMIATTPDGGTAEAESPCKTNGREALPEGGFVVGFNADYLTQAVEGIESERVRIGLTAPERAAILDGDNGTRALVMPLRLLD